MQYISTILVCLYIYIHSPATLLGAPVQLLGNTNCKPIRWQQLNAFRHLDVVKTTCWSSNRCWSTGDFHAQPSLGFTENGPKKRKYPVSGSCVNKKCLVDVRGQRRMGRLVRDDKKATVTQITNRYNICRQNTISEHTTCRTLKQMGYSSRRPHRVPLLSAKNRKQRLQFTQAHQNWTISSLDFCCDIQMVGFRIWRKEHESMDPSYLVSTVQAGGGGVMVWEIFSWHSLGPLVPIEHHLIATAYLNIVPDHVHPFITTVYHLLMTTSSRIMLHVTKLKSSQTGFLNMTMSSRVQVYSNGLHSHQISIQ